MDEAADTVQRLRLHRLQWAANSEAWVSAIRGSDEPLVRDLLYNFHTYSDDRLLQLAQEQRVHIGFTVERLPFVYRCFCSQTLAFLRSIQFADSLLAFVRTR
ncbi:uncharacterized protein LOC122817878 isoform X6 [Drosophila biarmipes]|uniref:uncharacterized protein LOC122817878 isoform X6 n=1 Tax=Drosophila biarmipes TaxID=125945 RepID=UPI0021CC7299|nr:uncharacterized protein LOC122817878 isoform X6 [Drosophila biarmipes]